jgi:hypothetical protein
MKTKNETVAATGRKWRNFFILILAIFLAGINSGCVPTNESACPATGNASAFSDGIEIRGAEFKIKIADQSGLLPTERFWFAGNDDKTIEYAWDEVLYREREEDTDSCDYANPAEGCVECNACTTLCTNGTARTLILQDSILRLKENLLDSDTETVLNEFMRPDLGCRRNLTMPNNSLPTFNTAKDNATYQLKSNNLCGSEEKTEESLQTFVVTTARALRENMEIYQDMTDPALRYRFKMPDLSGLLRENFSPSLRITKVRILRGIRDHHTGRQTVSDDAESLRRMRPSRIMFLPDLIEGNINSSSSERSNRCYFDPTVDDGNFNLQTNCLHAPFGGQHVRHNATPTYMLGRATETLTWVVEYKTTDGLPSVPEFGGEFYDEYPVLELTIE